MLLAEEAGRYDMVEMLIPHYYSLASIVYGHDNAINERFISLVSQERLLTLFRCFHANKSDLVKVREIRRVLKNLVIDKLEIDPDLDTNLYVGEGLYVPWSLNECYNEKEIVDSYIERDRSWKVSGDYDSLEYRKYVADRLGIAKFYIFYVVVQYPIVTGIE